MIVAVFGLVAVFALVSGLKRGLQLRIGNFHICGFTQIGHDLEIGLAQQKRTKLALNLVECRRLLVTLVLDLDDVEAELCLDRLLGIFASVERESCRLEIRDHLARAEIAQIAAIGSSAVLRLLLGDRLEVAALVEIGNDRLGLFLGRHENVSCAHFLGGRHRGDLLVILSANRFVGDVSGNFLLDIGAVQRTLAQHFHATLEIIRVGKALGFGFGRQKADLNERGQRGGAALLLRQLSKLLVQIRQCDFKICFRHRITVDGGDHLVTLRERDTCQQSHGGSRADTNDRHATERVIH